MTATNFNHDNFYSSPNLSNWQNKQRLESWLQQQDNQDAASEVYNTFNRKYRQASWRFFDLHKRIEAALS